MEDDEIRSLVTRLARAHPSGGTVIERAAILAEGADFDETMAWIIAHGGQPEAIPEAAPSGGLHGARSDRRGESRAPKPRRFVLPPDALS